MKRLDGRECQILMAEAPLPDDPSAVVPVSYKVSHELREDEDDPKLVDLVARLERRRSSSKGRQILYNWLGATRLDWRGQGHFRALTEEQEVWAVAQGYDEIVVKTKNRYYDMRGTLDSLQFNVDQARAGARPARVEGVPEQAAGSGRARRASEPAAGDACVGASRSRSSLLSTAGSNRRRRRLARPAGDRGLSRDVSAWTACRWPAARRPTSATVPATTTSRAFLPDGSGLLFTSNRDGKQTDIYRYDIASARCHQVTRTPESEYSPLVTPDRQIVFGDPRGGRRHAATLAVRSRRIESAARAREREAGRLSRVDRRDAPRAVRARRPGAAEHASSGGHDDRSGAGDRLGHRPVVARASGQWAR